ncbi:MAG: phosphoesterase [Desulfobacteraceae bacterium]|nr:phosphoesterase [Desulfobacteraceae bacterium]
MNLSTRERLNHFYARFNGDDHVLIAINADPDAIASAMAVKRLLWRKAASVTIGHVNVIKRPDNLAMVRLLGVKMFHMYTIDPIRYNRFVMVDSQPNHHELLASIRPDVLIDHHPDTGVEAPFRDIRPTYGATATILTEYLKAAKIKPSGKLATGLFLAIKIDTSNFERQTQIEDVRAFQHVFKYANIALVRRIEQAELQRDFLKYFQKALAEKRFRKDRVFVHLGQVVNPDVCVLIADFFMRLESVTWSIVSGFYNKKLIIIFRNDGIRKNAGKVVRNMFCALGAAGGHKSAARAEIPVDALRGIENPADDKKVLNWLIRDFEKKMMPASRRTTKK